MKFILFLIGLLIINEGFSQSSFTFNGYTAGQTFTTNAYTFSNTPIANCVTMNTRVTHPVPSVFMNLTGQLSPNYHANYSCSQPGLYLASNRGTTGAICTVELSFSQPVCAPLTFTITDINGANVSLPTYGGFRDDVTISAFDQNNVAIPLTTAMVTNNGSGSCNGGSYNGGNYTHVSVNSLKLVGCTYDDCAVDYFTIYSSTKMISRIVIDYVSGTTDWGGTAIGNPDIQYIIVNNVRAWTPCFNLVPNCGPPISITATSLSGFPPLTAGSGRPSASYPNPSISASTAATYAWTGTAGTIASPNPASLPATTNITGLSASGGTFTLTGQNNRGCIATKSLLINNSICVSLPIELLTFEGICFAGKRNFYWSTASEINNDLFVLEQSENGTEFQEVQRVDGSGTTQELTTYMTTVNNDSGEYFRLKQIDFDGVSKLSDIISVRCEDELIDNQVSVQPNPGSDIINIEIKTHKKGTYSVSMVDLYGKTVYLELDAFANGRVSTINVSDLSSGNYMVRILNQETGELIGFTKFSKTN